jgi:hypothetical protein
MGKKKASVKKAAKAEEKAHKAAEKQTSVKKTSVKKKASVKKEKAPAVKKSSAKSNPAIVELDLDELVNADKLGNAGAIAHGLTHVEPRAPSPFANKQGRDALNQIGTDGYKEFQNTGTNANKQGRDALNQIGTDGYEEFQNTGTNVDKSARDALAAGTFNDTRQALKDSAAKLVAQQEAEDARKLRVAADAEAVRINAQGDAAKDSNDARAKMVAERIRKAALKKERDEQLAAERAEEAARVRSEKQAAADAKTAAKEAKKQAVLAEKADWAAQVKTIESKGLSVFEKNMALKALREVDALRKAEAAKIAAEEEVEAKREAKQSFMSRFQVPTGPVSKTAGDMTMARNRSARQNSTWSVPKSDGSRSGAHREPVRMPEFDPQKQYQANHKHLATNRRPVGKAKGVFNAINEDLDYEGISGFGELDLGTSIYVETLIWSFHNRKSVNDFLDMVKEIRDEGRQAEAYYQVFEIPADVAARSTPVPLRQVGNAYVPSSAIQVMTVAIGTTEQYTDLHRQFDMREILNHDTTPYSSTDIQAARSAKQLQNQRGIKQLTGTFYCMKPIADVKDVYDSWNSTPGVNIKFQLTKGLTVPGGIPTVTKYFSTSRDLLMSLGTHDSADNGASEAAMVWFEVIRSEYQKKVQPIQTGPLFKGIATPIDFAVRRSAKNFSSFGVHSTEAWLATKASIGADLAADMDGVSVRRLLFFGPGASRPDMAAYIATLKYAGLTATVLQPVQYALY